MACIKYQLKTEAAKLVEGRKHPSKSAHKGRIGIQTQRGLRQYLRRPGIAYDWHNIDRDKEACNALTKEVSQPSD